MTIPPGTIETIALAFIGALFANLPAIIIALRARRDLGAVKEISTQALDRTVRIEEKVKLSADILTQSGRRPRPEIMADAAEEIGIKGSRQ